MALTVLRIFLLFLVLTEIEHCCSNTPRPRSLPPSPPSLKFGPFPEPCRMATQATKSKQSEKVKSRVARHVFPLVRLSFHRGSTANLPCAVNNYIRRILWYKNGRSLPRRNSRYSHGNLTHPSLKILQVREEDEAKYTCYTTKQSWAINNATLYYVEITDCAFRRYGELCENECGICANNKTCNSSFGHCDACASGWKGEFCRTKVKPVNKAAEQEQIVAVSIGVGASATMGLVLAFLQLVKFLADGLPSFTCTDEEDSEAEEETKVFPVVTPEQFAKLTPEQQQHVILLLPQLPPSPPPEEESPYADVENAMVIFHQTK